MVRIDGAAGADRRQTLRGVIGVVLIGVLAGCATPRPARSERIERPITDAPPAEFQEQPPEPPSPDAYWISGHWRWEGPGYVWYTGHWERPRVGYVLVRAYWTNEGGQWVYRPSRWVPATRPAEYAEVVIAQPAPPVRVESIGPAPGPGFFWLSGYWRWTGARHAWVAGRWEPYRPGFYWVSAQWTRVGVNYRFVGGHWRRH